MSIINFDEFRESKENKSRNSFESSSNYYVNILGSIRLDFGGALLRSFTEKIVQNKDFLKLCLEKEYESSVKVMSLIRKQINDEDVLKSLENNVNTNHTLKMNFLDFVEDEYSLDKCFEEDSDFLPVLNDLLSIVFVKFYNEFDYYRMEKNKWFLISKDISYLIELEEFKYLRSLCE